MSAYRVPAYVEPPAAIVVSKPRGLVRANGAVCRCSPPNWLYCWWFSVQPEDRWFCEHGGGWVRYWSYSTGSLWREMPAPPESDE
jgi:hypothetical protein